MERDVPIDDLLFFFFRLPVGKEVSGMFACLYGVVQLFFFFRAADFYLFSLPYLPMLTTREGAVLPLHMFSANPFFLSCL